MLVAPAAIGAPSEKWNATGAGSLGRSMMRSRSPTVSPITRRSEKSPLTLPAVSSADSVANGTVIVMPAGIVEVETFLIVMRRRYLKVEVFASTFAASATSGGASATRASGICAVTSHVWVAGRAHEAGRAHVVGAGRAGLRVGRVARSQQREGDDASHL